MNDLLENLANAEFIEFPKEEKHSPEKIYACFGDETCFCDDGVNNAKYSLNGQKNEVYEMK